MPATLATSPASFGSSYAAKKAFETFPTTPLRARPLDGAAFVVLPRLAKLFGYTFEVGQTPALRRDAALVVTSELDAAGLIPSPDIAWFGQRYDDATTWVVAYARGLP